MESRESAHEHIMRRLRLPQWYGRNLDALHDCLGEIGRPTTILVRNTLLLQQNLGDYGGRLLALFKDAASENENIRLVLHERF